MTDQREGQHVKAQSASDLGVAVEAQLGSIRTVRSALSLSHRNHGIDSARVISSRGAPTPELGRREFIEQPDAWDWLFPAPSYAQHGSGAPEMSPGGSSTLDRKPAFENP